MIQDKQLLGLGAVALGLLILTVLVYSVDPSRERAFQRGMPLVQGLATEAIGGIVIERGADSVHLLQRGHEFQVREAENYPVDTEAFHALLFRVLGLRAGERVGAGEEAAAYFGFTGEGADPTRVRLLDKDGETLTELEFADPAGQGTAVRREGRPDVYATESPVRIDADARSYMDTVLLDISLEDLRSVRVAPTEGDAFEIVMDAPKPGAHAEEPTPRLVTVKDGELADPKALARWVTAVRSINFEAPHHPGTLGEIDWRRDCTVRTDKVTYRLRLGVVEDRWVCAVSAEGPSDKAIQDVLQHVRSGEQNTSMKRADELIQARQVAEVYTRRHASWVYTLPEGKRETLQKARNDFLQDPAQPTSIGARHILVAYEGAERSTVARTRDEAQARAAEVLAKVRAEGADFGALANEYSDDPGGGGTSGDLGVFERGTMAEEFDAAAFALTVGEISDVVETPFGFHVIQRTQ